ncbi:hypothetical protein EJ110_NYTH45567 [Nymphaea thermarum]|nr:hypothetical protein EJ110_NYTH45567 [Nymphaea thermarum]
MAAASWAFPASEITRTSMGSFLTLSTEDCRNGVTTMNELSSYGESSAVPFASFSVHNSMDSL